MKRSNSHAFRRRILSAIGLSAMTAAASQCGEAPDPCQGGAVVPQCFAVEAFATCRDGGALGTSGEGAGGNGSAGEPGAPATCPPARDAEICMNVFDLGDTPPVLVDAQCCYEGTFLCFGDAS